MEKERVIKIKDSYLEIILDMCEGIRNDAMTYVEMEDIFNSIGELARKGLDTDDWSPMYETMTKDNQKANLNILFEEI